MSAERELPDIGELVELLEQSAEAIADLSRFPSVDEATKRKADELTDRILRAARSGEAVFDA